MNVEAAVLGSLSLIVLMVRALEPCESQDSRVKVKIAVLGSPSLLVCMISGDVKQQRT